MRSLDDTIAAISTPMGQGGIGIVRVTGPEAASILSSIFQPGGHLAGRSRRLIPRSHHLYYGHVRDPDTLETADEVLASLMRAPNTYTRQDVVEINCHGGIVPLSRILSLILRQGARLAEPGEFTLRAFLNGRLDLAQAEAVLDIIQAKTDAGLRVAVGQLQGHLSAQVRAARAALVEIMAYLEATIDFVEDDVPHEDISPRLAACERTLHDLREEAAKGILYRQGINTAIVGRPNVGKSSLLNALLRADRAIVTPIPGTTRDTLEETINLSGIPVCLVDTAGITATADPIENMGVARSHAAIRRADLVIMVVDGSEALTDQDHEIADLLGGKAALLAINKVDLPQLADIDGFRPNARRVAISALTGKGLRDLERAIEGAILGGSVSASDAPLVSNPRHQEILRRSLEHVREAQGSLAAGLPSDFVSIDVGAAVEELGEITGETATDELLDTIFRRFCIGK